MIGMVLLPSSAGIASDLKQAHPETGSVGHTHTAAVDWLAVPKAFSSTVPLRGDRETFPIQD